MKDQIQATTRDQLKSLVWPNLQMKSHNNIDIAKLLLTPTRSKVLSKSSSQPSDHCYPRNPGAWNNTDHMTSWGQGHTKVIGLTFKLAYFTGNY